MKVFILSLDSSILDKNSDSYKRMKDYATLIDELYVLVFGKKSGVPLTEDNLYIYLFSANFIGWLQAFFFGKKLIQEKQIDVVSAQDPFETGLLGFLISRFSQSHRPDRGTAGRAGLNVQLHGDFYGNPYWRRERLLNRLRWHLGLFVLRYAQSIRVVSERIKINLVSSFKFQDSRIIKVPIYTDIEYFRNAVPAFNLKEKYPQFNFIILTVANLVPVKNLEFLIGAIKKLHEMLPQAGLVIVGDGPLKKNLQSAICNLQYIIFEGAQKDLIPYYKGADCFVLVSKYEGWGRAVVEAAASGLPIIMTDVGLAGEVIKHNKSGFILLARNVDQEMEFARAVSQLYFNPNLRKQLIAGAEEELRELPSKSETLEFIKKSWELALKKS